jgi:hypothetical protein
MTLKSIGVDAFGVLVALIIVSINCWRVALEHQIVQCKRSFMSAGLIVS